MKKRYAQKIEARKMLKPYYAVVNTKHGIKLIKRDNSRVLDKFEFPRYRLDEMGELQDV